jgi:hypothetical protein
MLSTPAYVASFAYLVLLVIILLTPGVADVPSKTSSFGSRLMFVLFMLVPIALSVYSINCYVTGGCYLWSWLNVAGIVLWVFLLALVVLTSRNSTKDAESKEINERFFADWRVSANKK